MSIVPIKSFNKDPLAILDYTLDWSEFLPSGDPITSADVYSTAGITVQSDTFTATTHTIWLSGGTEGTSYFITSEVVTQAGRKDRRTFLINVKSL